MNKTTNKFSPEVRARAVRMILDHEGDYPSRWSAVVSVGLVTVLRRSLMSLCHLCFERQRADATQIRVAATGVVEPVDVLEDCCLCLPSC